MPDIRALRYFVAVVEQKSITHAAELLGIAQPPLSTQIKALEEKLGVQLLLREARGVKPTTAGSAFYKSSRKILNELEQAVIKAQSIDREISGSLLIGATRSTLSHPTSKKAIAAFIRQHRYVDVSFTSDGSPELCAALNKHQIDVAIARPLPEQHPDIKAEEISVEPMMVALPVSETDKLNNLRDAISLEQLIGIRAVLYRDSTDPVLYKKITELFDSQKLVLTEHQIVPSAHVALDFVSAGLGFTLVPQSLCDKDPEHIHYASLHTKYDFRSSTYLYTRHAETRDHVRAFRALLMAQTRGTS